MERVALAAATMAALALTIGSAKAGQLQAINLTVAHSWSGVAPCLSPAGRSAESIEAKLLAAAGGAVVESAEVHGFELQRQPAHFVEAFRQLTRFLPRGKRAPEPCHDVLCASRAVFGEAEGPRLLLLAAVYHYVGAPPGGPGDQIWTVSELDQLLAAFGDLPPSMFPMDKTEYRLLIHRHRKAGLGPAPTQLFELAAEAGEGQPGIVVAKGWHKADPAERRAIIVHELAHEFTRAKGESLRWRARWTAAREADERNAVPGGGPAAASAYALRNIDEDFAESVTAYRYMAPMLKRRAPHRYALVREMVFDGREYGSASSCTVRRAS